MMEPTRGEIWWLDLDPVAGSEQAKARPVVVMNAPAFDRVATRIIVPLTTWREPHARQINKVQVPASDLNGLDVDSAADCLQIRAVSLQRFERRIGLLEAAILEDLAAGIAIAVDYHP